MMWYVWMKQNKVEGDVAHVLKQSASVFAEDVVVRGLPRSTVHPSDQGLFDYTRALYGQFSHCEP